jgi:hypothetical protein
MAGCRAFPLVCQKIRMINTKFRRRALDRVAADTLFGQPASGGDSYSE